MTALVLCSCGLAKDTITVDGPSGTVTVLHCEHCDQPCPVRRCPQCDALYRSGARR